jgi:hypothetical protein
VEGDYTKEYMAKFMLIYATPPFSINYYLLHAQILEICVLCLVDATSLCRPVG